MGRSFLVSYLYILYSQLMASRTVSADSWSHDFNLQLKLQISIIRATSSREYSAEKFPIECRHGPGGDDRNNFDGPIIPDVNLDIEKENPGSGRVLYISSILHGGPRNSQPIVVGDTPLSNKL